MTISVHAEPDSGVPLFRPRPPPRYIQRDRTGRWESDRRWATPRACGSVRCNRHRRRPLRSYMQDGHNVGWRQSAFDDSLGIGKWQRRRCRHAYRTALAWVGAGETSVHGYAAVFMSHCSRPAAQWVAQVVNPFELGGKGRQSFFGEWLVSGSCICDGCCAFRCCRRWPRP